MLILFSFVFSLPVSAAKLDPISGVISLEPETLGLRRNSLTENTIYGFQSAPASFELSDDTYRFTWQSVTAYTGFYSTVSESGKELSFIFNFGDGVGDVLVSWDTLHAKPLFRAVFADDTSQLVDFTWTGDFDMFVDGSRVYHRDLTDDPIPSILNWEGSVSRYIEVRITSLEDSINVVDIEDASIINQYIAISTNGLTVNDESVIIEDISVSVKSIEQDLGDIKDSVGNIESGLGDLNDTADSINSTVTNINTGVTKIDGTITDMSQQLQDPDSNIWEAGASTIKDSVTELFVPSEDDLADMQQDLNLTLASKVQPLYFAIGIGDEISAMLSNAFSQAGAHARYFDFPGIALPLNGIEYVIIPAQQVSINNDIVIFLQTVFAVIVGIICFLQFIHLLEDAYFCIISGVSFWGFIRGRHDL